MPVPVVRSAAGLMAATRTLVLLLTAPFGPARSRPGVLARFLERVLAGATRSLVLPGRSGFLVTVLAAPVPRSGRAVGVLADFLVLALAATTPSVTVFGRSVLAASLSSLLYPSPTGILAVPVVGAPAVLLSVFGPGTVLEF